MSKNNRSNKSTLAASTVAVLETTIEAKVSSVIDRFTFDDSGAHLAEGLTVTPDELGKAVADQADAAASASLRPLMLAEFARTLPDVTVPNGTDATGKALTVKVSAFDYVMAEAEKNTRTPSAWQNVKGLLAPMRIAKAIAPDKWVGLVFHAKEAKAFLESRGIIEEKEGKLVVKDTANPVVLAIADAKPINGTLRPTITAEKQKANEEADAKGLSLPFANLKPSPFSEAYIQAKEAAAKAAKEAAEGKAPDAPASGAPATSGAPAPVAPVAPSGPVKPDDIQLAKTNLGSAVAFIKNATADAERAIADSKAPSVTKKTLAVALTAWINDARQALDKLQALASEVKK